MAHRASLATRAALVAAGVALTVVAPPSGAAPLGAPPCNKPGRFVTQPHFLAMSLPKFPDSDYPSDTLITPAHRNVVSSDYGLGRTFNAAVTDASTVYVTADGGCNWSTAYSLPAVADTDGNSGALTNVDKVLAVAVSKQPGTHDIYVDVEGPNLHTSDARLLVSHSGGSSFTTHQFPGLVSAHPVTSPVETGVTYVLGHPSDAAQPQLWRTDDAGGHWTACTVPPGVQWGSTQMPGLYVDPMVRRRVWAYTSDGTGTVFRSDDAGRTWKRIGQVGSHIQFFALWYRGRTAVLATAPSPTQAPAPDATPGSTKSLPYFLLELSTNGGATWRELRLPVDTAQANAVLVGLAQPPRQESVSAIMEFTPDNRSGSIHALTLTGNRWRATGQLPWADESANLPVSAPVLPGSVGTWWFDFSNPSMNWLFRYSREP